MAKKVKKLKLKTHRGAAKRFKITATGKVMRMHSGKRHLLGTKKANRMRRLKKMKQVSSGGRRATSTRCCRTASGLRIAGCCRSERVRSSDIEVKPKRF